MDFTGASFDEDALRAMKECAVFDKPYIKKATWVGVGVPSASIREGPKSLLPA